MAVHFTVVVPTGKVEPEGGEQITGAVPSTRSVAVGGAKVTTAPAALVASTVWFAGTPLIVGGVVSTTTTLNVVFVAFPAASTAIQVTTVSPTGKSEPALSPSTRI